MKVQSCSWPRSRKRKPQKTRPILTKTDVLDKTGRERLFGSNETLFAAQKDGPFAFDSVMNQNAGFCIMDEKEAALFDRQGNRKYLNGAERKLFFRAANKELDDLCRAFCFVLFYTGCRISEALMVSAERIDLTGKSIVFETLKRRKRGHFRSVPIPDNLVALLGSLVAGRERSARVWTFSRPTAYRLIKNNMAAAGILGGKACPKGLRHGFAIACVGQGIPLTTVQKWLGHARLETTAIYLDASGEEEREFAMRVWKAG